MIEYAYLERADGVADPAGRMDPFFDGAWTLSAAATWLSTPSVQAAVGAGLARFPENLTPMQDPPNPFDQVRSGDRRAALVACARMWGSLTIEQAAAVIGYDTSLVLRDARALFRAGVLDLGMGVHAGLSRMVVDERCLVGVRPAKAVRAHLRAMPWPQYLAVTGDRPWARASASARHNALTVETCLRVATWLDTHAVVGEMVSYADDLFGTGVGGQFITRSKRGDATVIRADGVRIVVETTASASPHFKDKVTTWARLLAAHPGSDVIVLFLCAPPLDRSERTFAAKVKAQVAAACARHPGTVLDPTRQRLAVVDYTDWFPARGCVDERFFTLEADVGGQCVPLAHHEIARRDPRVPGPGLGLLAGVPWWQRRSGLDAMAPLVGHLGTSLDRRATGFGTPLWPRTLRGVGRTRAGS
ncbi:MAG: hypothetical protein E6640_01825 [Actinomyces urogenitalis]|uniref:hypothetical protein n=1 Tax=Actinomyces urogenitalis TaxID=103621 RepID=UPI00291192D6|nr:hypothetical protein [Actinomyces urogenitalis]MDU6150950.1 hypothetical protein [Actinomyces urogenitalis]